MRLLGTSLVCGIVLFSVAACAPKGNTAALRPAAASAPPAGPAFAAVDGSRLLAADAPANDGQWMSYGRDYDEQRFSPLTQIDTQTVSHLGLAWFADFDTHRGQESTPLAIDGVIFVTTAWSKVYAFQAATGKQAWETQVTDKGKPYSITGAPRIAAGRVFIGEAGSGFSQRGFMSA